MEVKAFSLAILGDTGVGKTSFSNRFTQNSFNRTEKPTIGAEYFQKIYYYNNQSVKLDIYGTSGNEKYKKISKYLYKDARSIILMYKINDKKTFNNLKHYLDNIKQYSVENPIIYIVGNYSDLKESRQVDKEDLINLAKEEGLKYFEISCKTGMGVNEVIMELTKEIVVTGKWYMSKIFKDLGDINAAEKAEKENDKLKKNLKNFLKDKRPNFFRCQACDRLFVVRFKTMFNEIQLKCNNCNFDTNIPFSMVDAYLDNLSNRVICGICKKKNDAKYKLNYCYKCKEFICPSCDKVHERKVKGNGENGHYLCPYFLMDIACYKDVKKNLGYCKICKQSFCPKCINDHKKHEFMYFDDFIEQLTKEGKDNIQKEIILINEFKKNCEDCLNTLKKTIYHFINIKEKEIKLKEQLLLQLSNIQYNYQLIETVKNLRYIKKLKYDKNSLWEQKLTDIFEVLGFPIQIKTINISKGANSTTTPEKISLRKDAETTLGENQKEITDVCGMNYDQYIGITYNNGSLELFNNLIKSKDPLSVFQIFDNEQPINSMQKSIRNINNYFFCGNDKIKNIEFYDNYKSYKTINEIVEEQKVFQLCLEQNDYYLTSDAYNRIELYSKENKKLEDISDCIDPSCRKHIISFYEISNDKIYINFNKLSENDAGVIRGGGGRISMLLNDIDDMTIDFTENGNTVKQQIDLGTKIIELNYNRIKREYLLPNKQEILGVLNDNLILIRDDLNGSVILFDVKTFKNTQRFHWDLGGNPIFIGILNKRINLIDFILIDDNMNIFQNIYDEETKSVTQISGLKNKNEGLEIDPEVLKRGKIIQNPFKNIVNYIGDNDFIVVNY